MPSALTKYRGMVAVGSSAGAIHVLMPAGKREPHGCAALCCVALRCACWGLDTLPLFFCTLA